MAATAVPTPRPMQIIPVRPPQIHAHGHARPDITAAVAPAARRAPIAAVGIIVPAARIARHVSAR